MKNYNELNMMELDTLREDGVLTQMAAERGIRLSFLTDYQHLEGSARPHTLVINYPALDPERLPRGLEELFRLLD